jgi:hypothetical protein
MSLRAVLVLSVAAAMLLLAAVQTASAGYLNEYTYEGKTIDVFTLDPWTGAPAGVTPTTTEWLSDWTVPKGVSSVDLLVVAGGGAGGLGDGPSGGGGAGGLIYSTGFAVSPGGAISVTVGAGGIASRPPGPGINGADSVFGALIAIGGGGGGGLPENWGGDGQSGGSGGGAACD